MNDVSLKGDLSQGIAFKLSGVFDAPYLTIAAYSADIKEPDDERFIVWRIEPARRNTSGEPAWKVGYFRIEDQVPENHLLRLIDRHVSFEFVREKLRNSYSDTGRPDLTQPTVPPIRTIPVDIG